MILFQEPQSTHIPVLHKYKFSQHTSSCGEIKVVECCVCHLKVGTFENSFESNTFAYTVH